MPLAIESTLQGYVAPDDESIFPCRGDDDGGEERAASERSSGTTSTPVMVAPSGSERSMGAGLVVKPHAYDAVLCRKKSGEFTMTI